jgi:hypothetical protein
VFLAAAARAIAQIMRTGSGVRKVYADTDRRQVPSADLPRRPDDRIVLSNRGFRLRTPELRHKLSKVSGFKDVS